MSLSRTSPLLSSMSIPTQEIKTARLVYGGVLALCASMFVALCAHFSIPLPFTPVPFTLQPFAVVLVGMLLGPVGGFAALTMYLLEAAMGLPVLTPGGPGGVAQLVGPSGGFLLSYPLVAALAGGMPRLFPRPARFVALVAGGALAMVVLFACGATWFGVLLHASLHQALAATVLPFVLSDAVKVCAAAGIASALKQRHN